MLLENDISIISVQLVTPCVYFFIKFVCYPTYEGVPCNEKIFSHSLVDDVQSELLKKIKFPKVIKFF